MLPSNTETGCWRILSSMNEIDGVCGGIKGPDCPERSKAGAHRSPVFLAITKFNPHKSNYARAHLSVCVSLCMFVCAWCVCVYVSRSLWWTWGYCWSWHLYTKHKPSICRPEKVYSREYTSRNSTHQTALNPVLLFLLQLAICPTLCVWFDSIVNC